MLCQVLCSLSPPDGCLQWHEGSSGSVQSFNNGGTGTHLASQVGRTGHWPNNDNISSICKKQEALCLQR